MATKLEGLHIKKVDFVDQGANQMANIKIKKSKDGEEISNPEVGLFKRFVNWITGELSKSDSEITKSATTFNEQINAVSMDAIRDEIWSTCYALQFKEEPMKLVANKPCNLNGKKYFIGEEVPVEEVVDYASLVKMGLLSVIHDAVPEDNLEECVAMVGEVSFSIPIVKGHETIDLDVTEPQMQDAVKTMQMSADAAVAHIRGNIEDDTTLIIINALDSRATVKKAAESKAKNLIEQEESKGDA